MKNITEKRSDPVIKIINLFLAITAHCHGRAAIKIHITHFTRICNDHLIL